MCELEYAVCSSDLEKAIAKPGNTFQKPYSNEKLEGQGEKVSN